MGLRSDIDLANSGYNALVLRVEELEMPTALATKYDQDADPPTLAYLGQALPGVSSATAGWRIQKLVFGGDGDVVVTWADGNANFDNVWDNRASLTYT